MRTGGSASGLPGLDSDLCKAVAQRLHFDPRSGERALVEAVAVVVDHAPPERRAASTIVA
jgi:hypothetical protein